MEKVLLISRDSSIEARLGDLLGSPRHLARISSWPEAHRVMTRSTPFAVVLSHDMLSPAEVTELVRLNNLLKKERAKAYILAPGDDDQIRQWADMFETIVSVFPHPGSPSDWQALQAVLLPLLPQSRNASTQEAATPAAIPLTLSLPVISTGSLQDLPLARLLYLLSLQKASGILHLEAGSISRRFAFHNGHFAPGPQDDSASTLGTVFTWPRGEYRFENRQTSSSGSSPVLSLIQDGIANHQPQRQIMDALMPQMATFPTCTTLWSTRRTKIQWPVLSAFLAKATGTLPLEKILSSMGRDVNEAFRAALFAARTDLLVFRDQSTSSLVELDYQFASSSPSQPQRTRSNSGNPTPEGTQRLATERELKATLSKFDSMTPHQIFGVWEGCGREVVKESFYQLVKIHHPDVYGGNVSPPIKANAQKIFVKIRKAYGELMKLEGAQTVPPPTPRSPSSPSSAPSSKTPTNLATARTSSPAVAHRARTSSVTGLGRESTDARTRLQSSHSRRVTPATTSTRAPSSSSKPLSSSPTHATVQTPSGLNVSPGGLGDDLSDAEWRKQRLQSLERKPNRVRRPTPIAPSAASISPPTDPAQQAFNDGFKLFKQDLFADALPLFQKAYELEKDNGLYMTFYAHSLFKTDPGNDREAVRLLKEAIETEHRQALPDAHFFLGSILKLQGKEDRAYKHFKKSLELNPASRDAEREIRLHERRYGSSGKNASPDEEGFFKKLFKK